MKVHIMNIMSETIWPRSCCCCCRLSLSRKTDVSLTRDFILSAQLRWLFSARLNFNLNFFHKIAFAMKLDKLILEL